MDFCIVNVNKNLSWCQIKKGMKVVFFGGGGGEMYQNLGIFFVSNLTALVFL